MVNTIFNLSKKPHNHTIRFNPRKDTDNASVLPPCTLNPVLPLREAGPQLREYVLRGFCFYFSSTINFAPAFIDFAVEF